MQHTPYYKCTKLLSDFTNGSGFNKVFRQMSILLDSFKTVGSHLQEFRILFLTGWENSQRTPTPLCKAPALSAPWHFFSTPHQYSKHEIRWVFFFPPFMIRLMANVWPPLKPPPKLQVNPFLPENLLLLKDRAESHFSYQE